jgi:hypothetical protein
MQMKFKQTPPMPYAAVQRLTRANQAWAVDHALIDLHQRIFVRLITDVGTRLPLSATPTFGIADIGTGIERLVDRSGKPEQIWLDSHHGHRSDPALRSWAAQQGISIIYIATQMPQMKSLSERLFISMSAFLRTKRSESVFDLGHDLERWRKSYVAEPLINVNP